MFTLLEDLVWHILVANYKLKGPRASFKLYLRDGKGLKVSYYNKRIKFRWIFESTFQDNGYTDVVPQITNLTAAKGQPQSLQYRDQMGNDSL